MRTLSALFLVALVTMTGVALAGDVEENFNLTGTWSSVFGSVVLTQTASEIIGSYQYTNDDGIKKEGSIQGTLRGKTIQARWSEHPSGGGRPQGRIGEDTQGTLEWQVISGGKTLLGWYIEDGDNEKHEWTLER
ncbi:exported hypothetical protein [Gammaproteobacteria bacterium]